MESRLTAPGREGLLASVFHGSRQGVAVARLEDGRILEANDSFAFLLGCPRDELAGVTTFALGLWSELGDQHARDMLNERGAIDGFDTRVLTRNGEHRILRLWAEVVDVEGEPHVVVRASDVDGRASAGARYQELREAEVRYRALVEQVPAIIYTEVSDPDSPSGTRDTYIGPQIGPMLGYDAEEFFADPTLWERITHPEDLERANSRSTERTGRPFCAEYRMFARDGRMVWFRDEAVLIEDPATGLRFWQGVMLDITDQKWAEERLVELEAKYRTLVEQIPAVVYVGEYGEDGRWLYISPQIERLLGYTPEEWLAHPHPMQSFTHPDDIAAARAEEARSQREGDAFRAEYRMQTKEGRWVWILDEATAVRDETGRPLVLQGTMFDMTERKRAEEELAEAVEQLRALDRLKDTLLHTLAHDLKGPLTAIMGAASTLERLDQQLPDDERRNLLRTMASRTRAMNTLLTDLLDLERLDKGIVEPRRFPVDLGELIRNIATDPDLTGGRAVDVEAGRVVLNVDVPKLERVVENLVVNAIRHTPADCHVWVRLVPQDGGVVIAVEDDGPGVSDELKQEIFEAFRRGPHADGLPGSGIGLSLVARFAELHGGRAWVEDRAGGGASFRVLLPDLPPSVS